MLCDIMTSCIKVGVHDTAQKSRSSLCVRRTVTLATKVTPKRSLYRLVSIPKCRFRILTKASTRAGEKYQSKADSGATLYTLQWTLYLNLDLEKESN
eukprot:sb/3479092/